MIKFELMNFLKKIGIIKMLTNIENINSKLLKNHF